MAKKPFEGQSSCVCCSRGLGMPAGWTALFHHRHQVELRTAHVQCAKLPRESCSSCTRPSPQLAARVRLHSSLDGCMEPSVFTTPAAHQLPFCLDMKQRHGRVQLFQGKGCLVPCSLGLLTKQVTSGIRMNRVHDLVLMHVA